MIYQGLDYSVDVKVFHCHAKVINAWCCRTRFGERQKVWSVTQAQQG
jgi:hypothetical protein